jgi:hypothetical protein
VCGSVRPAAAIPAFPRRAQWHEGLGPHSHPRSEPFTPTGIGSRAAVIELHTGKELAGLPSVPRGGSVDARRRFALRASAAHRLTIRTG